MRAYCVVIRIVAAVAALDGHVVGVDGTHERVGTPVEAALEEDTWRVAVVVHDD
jgi:hypothetical protein